MVNGEIRAETFVSILIPALNEEEFIANAISTVAPRTPDIDYEIIVLDGGSHDRTRAIVGGLAMVDARLRLVDNPLRVQSAAINLGAQIADPRADVIVRADCHASYPRGFVEGLAAALSRVDAVSVVVPLNTVGGGCFHKAVAAAQNSRLGNGGSRHRMGGRSDYIDHGHHAAFRRSFFQSVGGYDESFTHNEDAELDYRIAQHGGRIWLKGDLPVTYYPRSGVGRLVRQYFNYGAGRARTWLKHRQSLKARQLLPLFVTVAVGFSLSAMAIMPAAAIVPAVYLMACGVAGILVGFKERSVCAALAGPVAVLMHLSWGTGFLWMLARRLGLGLQRPRAGIPVSS